MLRAFAVLAAVVICSSLASGVRAADQEPYTINVIASQTGVAAFVGQSITKTLGIAEAVINKQGGIRGRPVKFLIADDNSNPQVAVQLASKLIAEKVPVVLGPGFVATCSATMPLAQANGPVMYCFAPGIYPPAGSYVFSAGAAIDLTTLAFVRYFRERGWKRIAVLSSTDASGQSWDRGVAFALAQPENKDMQLVAHEHMNATDLSAAAQLARIKSLNPQGLFVLPTGTPFGTAMRGVADAGLDVPIVGGSGNLSYAQLATYQSFLPKEVYFPGAISLVPSVVGAGPIHEAQTAYFNSFREAGTPRPDVLLSVAWDPAMLVVSALRTLGPNAGAQQIRDYLVKLHGWVGIYGVYDFRDGQQRGVGIQSQAVFRYDNAAQTFTPVSRPGGFLK
jgi:branched-chain amino acid transport system substrate-binding protein